MKPIIKEEVMKALDTRRTNSNIREASMFYESIEDIKSANIRAGYNFFSQSTMKFWGTKVYRTIYAGRYFITADWNFDRSKKLFTVRLVLPTGGITKGSEFQAFSHLTQAQAWVRNVVAATEAK